MICRLCLNSSNDADPIHIFESRGQSLNVAPLISKHFWFEPKSDDPISTVICVACWSRLSDFHEFYEAVEKAHRLLTERFSIKNEQKEAQRVNTYLHLPEEHGSTQMPLVTDELILTSVLEEEEEDDEDEQAGIGDVSEGESNESFSNEQFLNEVLNHQELDLVENEPEEMEMEEKTETVTEDRRETRATAKSKAAAASVNPPEDTKPSKRRGRAIKVAKSAPKSKRYSDYKKSMLEIDQKISAHMRLTCDVCHEGQETFLLLCKHMMQVHHKKGYAICCNKKFYKRSFLTDHIDRHANPEKFKCQECGKTFADKQCLRNHELLKHQPEEEKTFMCEHCPKRYTKQYLLDQHRIIHKERNVPCNICERRFPNVSLLGSHFKLVHGNYGTMCDICAQVIRGRAAFQRHQLEHSGVTEPKVQCDICGSWHKNKYSLKKHIRRHQGSSEECTCNICGKVSPNRSAMLSHQRYVHLADRKHECSVCNKAFKKAITLKEHMTMHTGEVLYKCSHCPKTFNSNANKHSHRKKCHPKEFEEARKARSERRMASTSIDESQVLKITTIDDEGETHNILLTAATSNEDLKDDSLEFTICLSPPTQPK